MSECQQVPANPQDGDTFACPHCGYAATFVVLDDGLPGEWVDTDDAPMRDLGGDVV
jgi:hypothetical protein